MELLLDILWTAPWVVYMCVLVFMSVKNTKTKQNKKNPQRICLIILESTKQINYLAVQMQQINLTETHVPCPLFHEKRLLNTVPLSFAKTSVGIKLD